MLVAIPVWKGRVSPVFDVAGQVLLVELDRLIETARWEEPLADDGLDRRADRMAHWGVTTLVCGAISRPLESLLTARGIDVIPRVCGGVDEVLGAFSSGNLQSEQFAMPGCCNQRRRRQRGWRSRERKNQP
jgi:predicted Fe-Mo cluster-binding NifX family protein